MVTERPYMAWREVDDKLRTIRETTLSLRTYIDFIDQLDVNFTKRILSDLDATIKGLQAFRKALYSRISRQAELGEFNG